MSKAVMNIKIGHTTFVGRLSVQSFVTCVLATSVVDPDSIESLDPGPDWQKIKIKI